MWARLNITLSPFDNSTFVLMKIALAVQAHRPSSLFSKLSMKTVHPIVSISIFEPNNSGNRPRIRILLPAELFDLHRTTMSLAGNLAPVLDQRSIHHLREQIDHL